MHPTRSIISFYVGLMTRVSFNYDSPAVITPSWLSISMLPELVAPNSRCRDIKKKERERRPVRVDLLNLHNKDVPLATVVFSIVG